MLTGTRAEYGLLKPIIGRIQADKDLELCLLVTGAHLEDKFGYTYEEIKNDGFHIDYEIPMQLHSDCPKGILDSMALELQGISDIFEKEKIDMLILLGDRYEILVAAMCALINRVPIAHIHGGELTEGAIDDGIRHAVTKLSALHFVSTDTYRQRVIQMGELPEKVKNVGALGIENIHKVTFLTKEELTEKFGVKWKKPIIMVTFHPVTLENNTSEMQINSLLNVLKKNSQYSYVFTYANADTDGAIINKSIEEFVEGQSDCYVFKSMGQVGYLSMLNNAVAVVGNSSSGIIEAPSFRIPTINIGDRQKGRVRAKSVYNCDSTETEIELAMRHIFAKEFQDICVRVRNPYEQNDTSKKILMYLKEYLYNGCSNKKTFYDIHNWKPE